MGIHYSAHSLYGVQVDRVEWTDSEGWEISHEKELTLRGTPLVYLDSSPHYDCDDADRVLVIGVNLDGLDPGRIVEVIRGAPAALDAANIEGVPRLYTLLDVC